MSPHTVSVLDALAIRTSTEGRLLGHVSPWHEIQKRTITQGAEEFDLVEVGGGLGRLVQFEYMAYGIWMLVSYTVYTCVCVCVLCIWKDKSIYKNIHMIRPVQFSMFLLRTSFLIQWDIHWFKFWLYLFIGLRNLMTNTFGSSWFGKTNPSLASCLYTKSLR